MKYLLFALICTIAYAQKPARIGPDGKPLLNRPILEECKKRISHMEWGGHNYFISWREPWHKFEDWDWFNGRNFCRDRCMDLISFDTPEEFKTFAKIMQADNVSSIYTSGRKCNFKGKGCDASHLQPINANGWFWAGAGNTRIPDTSSQTSNTYWSFTGEQGQKQPDNFEGVKEGPIETEFDIGVTIEGLQEFHDEACLAALNNKYNDGISWHDVACHFRSVIVCEDSDQLLELIKKQNGEDVKAEVKKSEKASEIDSILLNEVEPLLPENILQQQQQLQQEQQQHPHGHHGHQPHHPSHHQNRQPPPGLPRRPNKRPPRSKPGRRPGLLSAFGFGGRFPFLF
ncbi:uncharacterized protein [Lepeophtheirus salmonis]|uniref:Lselectinlike [Bombus terrestris] n=2 Tax=Lepeophtheirus salmonis TaxID=72036 RepID=A0A0K2U6N4_LEPSM|nr:uncharacterized protein LOC121127670 [Lepeophtheirus salmonis]